MAASHIWIWIYNCAYTLSSWELTSPLSSSAESFSSKWSLTIPTSLTHLLLTVAPKFQPLCHKAWLMESCWGGRHSSRFSISAEDVWSSVGVTVTSQTKALFTESVSLDGWRSLGRVLMVPYFLLLILIGLLLLRTLGDDPDDLWPIPRTLQSLINNTFSKVVKNIPW